MNRAVKTIMERDRVTERVARELVEECRVALDNGDNGAVRDILGLDDEYIVDVLCLKRP